MKKIVLTIAAVLSMTMAFGETANNFDKAAFTIDVNESAMARALNLTDDQEVVVNEITARFEWDMRRVAKANDANRQKKLHKAVNRNLASLSKVLNKEQYRKYVAVLNSTFVNRGIISLM